MALLRHALPLPIDILKSSALADACMNCWRGTTGVRLPAIKRSRQHLTLEHFSWPVP